MNIRKLRVESLEERALLAVVAGGVESATELIAPTEATTWIVNTLHDPTNWDTGDDVVSLREAIGSAVDGDTVTFDDSLAGGTITLNGSQLEIKKGITIDASSVDGITIDANEKSRVFSISGGDESNPVELVSLTISGGKVQGSDANGGGLYNSGTLMIVNSMITGNTCVSSSDYYCSSVGGGIYNDSGTLTITNTTISQNTTYSSSSSSEFFSVSFGGGICNDSGTLTITNTTISQNTTYSSSSSSEYLCSSCGGGISNSGMLTITNSAISGNTSSSSSSEYLCSSRGGGISNTGTLTMTNSNISGNTSFSSSESYIDSGGGGLYNSGTLTITDCTVSANTSSHPSSCYNGGGILNNSGTLTITNSMISGNSASYAGGGIYNDRNGTLTVTNSTISGNTANYGGGIGNDYDGVLTVTNSMILENIAHFGGGIYNGNNGTLTVTNSTISGNTANSGSGIINSVGLAKLYNTIIVQNSTGAGNDEIRSFGSSIYAYNSLSTFIDWTESDECIVYDPTRPLFTDFENRDYTLDVGSQAINKGNNDYVTTETDLAGNARIVAEIVDLGAYEYQPETPSTIVTTLNDVVDETDELMSLREAIEYAQEGDIVTFAPELAGGTIALNGSQLEITKGITIDAIKVGGITIDGDAKSRVIYVDGGNENNPVRLIGLTITRGQINDPGGGICINSGTVIVRSSTIMDNSANAYGGGISNSGTLTVTDSVITRNIYGGGIRNKGTLTVTNSIITMNAGGNGGGIRNTGTLTVTGSSITMNSATNNGGGIYNGNLDGNVTVTDSIIMDNSAVNEGGGIYNRNTLTVTNSNIARNTADYCGGGIFDIGSLSITGSTIVGNNTVYYGGGICKYEGTLMIKNSTIAGNSAGDIGGGIVGGSMTGIINTIISLNYASSDNNVYLAAPIPSSNNIIGVDPGFKVAPVFENGKLVNADELDLSLTEKSIAIDTGKNSTVETETDIVGNPRISAAWREIPTVDIGAYEYQESVVVRETPSTVVTTNLDVLNAIDGLISLREAIFYAEAGETVTFDSSLAGQTIVLDGAELAIDKNLTVDASSIDGVTIDAGGRSRIFCIGNVTSSISVALIDLIIQNGHSYSGGGIWNGSFSKLTLVNTTVMRNNATRLGGGVCNDGGTLTVTNSLVTENNTVNGGGGIYNGDSSILNVSGSTVSRNSVADGSGGGINNYGTVTITNSIVFDNTAKNGGGIQNYDTQTITSSSVVGNNAEFIGGGIYNYSGTLNLYNSIVAVNGANEGTDISDRSSTYAYNSLSSFTEWTESAKCLEYDPARPLFNNPENGDFRLTVDSQAVNVGNNDYVTTEIDLAGNPRIVGGVVDLGAFESQTEGASTVVTILEDVVDRFDDQVSLREAVSLYSKEGDRITFDPSLAGRTILLNGTQLEITKGITIDANDIGGIIIDANGESRVFSVTGGSADHPVVLIGLVITGGNAESGGGIYSLSEALYLTKTTVSQNVANYDGGGIYNDKGYLVLSNCLLSDNSAEYDGGGFYNDRGTVTLQNVTVAGNVADHGGGVYNRNSSELILYNTIIAENVSDGADPNIGNQGNVYAHNTLSSFYDWTNTDQCVVYDPLQQLFTNLQTCDYTLSIDSQAVNSGNNDYVATDTDLAGNPRIVDRIVDLGAYEHQGNIPLPTPMILTGSRGYYVSYGSNRHLVTWDAVTGASAYEFEYSMDSGLTWISTEITETSAVVTGLTFGKDITYRVRALGEGLFLSSDWSAEKTFNVCPMDVNNDGDISGFDRSILGASWGTEEGDGNYRYYADINGDGDIGGFDRSILSTNWGHETGDADLLYPRPLAADMVFDEFASADLGVDLDVF